MTTKQFSYLSELVENIKATGDPAITAIACRTLNDLLRGDTHDDVTRWKEEIDA